MRKNGVCLWVICLMYTQGAGNSLYLLIPNGMWVNTFRTSLVPNASGTTHATPAVKTHVRFQGYARPASASEPFAEDMHEV
jgi:hypothetical protein